jgi:uncharacterized protein
MALPALDGLVATDVVVDVGRGLREAGLMLWDTLWALILGFSLSGAVQAFVARPVVQQRLGDHRPASVLRASVFGMASSSCSYAASAAANSLVQRGADFLSAVVFTVASTNLVVELGIVLWVLMGWQFVAAEFVGGAIMIALVVMVGSMWLRRRPLAGPSEGEPAHVPHPGDDGADAAGASSIRSLTGWSEAAGYTLGDLRMVGKELLLGFAVAGFLSALVPQTAWSHLFVHGHGAWTTLENAVIGPFVALISFVCSVGNVPLAAALWRGGIAFGGVVAFIFGDLITIPLLLIYRKQYGGRMALRLLGVLWLAMSAAGLIIDYLFRALGWVPSASRGVVITGSAIGWNWTSYLDLAAVVWAVSLILLRGAGRRRADRSPRVGTDPVCGMQVQIAHAAAAVEENDERWYFCSEGCRDRFLRRRDQAALRRT